MEDSLLYYVLYIAGAFIVMFMLRYILVAQNLLGISFRPPLLEMVARDQIPGHLKELYENKEMDLERLGFHYIYTQKVRDMVARKHEYRFYHIYFNPQERTYASITASPEADAQIPLWVDFSTYFKDGNKLMTVNGIRHNIIGTPPDTILQDGYFASLDDQWSMHLNYLNSVNNRELEIVTFEENSDGFREILEVENQRQIKYLEHLERTGYMYKQARGEGWYLLKFTAALKVANAMFSGMNKLMAMKKQLSLAGIAVEIPVQMEVENYENTRHMLQSRNPNSSGKLIFLLFSVVLFVGIFGLLFGFDIAAMLFVVVLIHESGHLLAMRAMGYKDLSMLFIPLFGAVAMGTDKGVKPYKRVIAYFAGPAPGILAAVLIWYLLMNGMVPAEYLRLTITAFATLAVINYFNLLPLVPLDGGRILETVIFSRSNLLQNIFLGFSFLGMIALAYFLKEPLLWIFALIVPFGYKENFTRGKLRREVENRVSRLEKAGESEITHETFASMKQEPYSSMPYAKKFKVAQFIESYFGRPKAKPVTTGVTLVAYVALFVLPLLYILYPIISGQGFPAFFNAGKNPCARVMTLEPPPVAVVEASISRFKRIDAAKAEGTSMLVWQMCFYMDPKGMKGNPPIFPQSEFLAGLWSQYGEPDRVENGFSYTLLDLESGRILTAYCTHLVAAYGCNEGSRDQAIRAVNVLHALVEKTPPADCEWILEVDYAKFQQQLMQTQGVKQEVQEYQDEVEEIPVMRYKLGAKNGEPFMTVLPEQTPPEQTPPQKEE